MSSSFEKNNFAVLVLSCDRYADLWPGFFDYFFKNFPKTVHQIYLGSNSVPFSHPQVKTLFTGDDKDWSTSFSKILTQIPEENLFVILEDLFITSPVDRHSLEKCINKISEPNINHIKYWPNPKPDQVYSQDPYFSVYEKGAPYRATVCGFWKKNHLEQLLIPGENPWNFEILGSYRSSYFEGYLATTEPLCEFKNLIEKGHWFADSKPWADSQNLALDWNKRPTNSGGKNLKSILQIIYFNSIIKISWKKRVKLMNLLRKLLVSY